MSKLTELKYKKKPIIAEFFTEYVSLTQMVPTL